MLILQLEARIGPIYTYTNRRAKNADFLLAERTVINATASLGFQANVRFC